jgi:endo-1,4-beta-xylanase
MTACPGDAANAPPVPVFRAEGDGVALTFDDGPNGKDTSDLLDFLAEHRLPAVFCVVGESIRAADGRELLRRMVAEGHVIGNHSTDFRDLGALSATRAAERMSENLAIIRDALGDVRAPVPFFRAPNGNWGPTAHVAVKLGMQPLAIVNTIDDWRESDPDVLADNLRAAMKKGELVLAHDGGGDRSATVSAVRRVVEEKLAEGWSFTLPVGARPTMMPGSHPGVA